jgi:hypothetical protein
MARAVPGPLAWRPMRALAASAFLLLSFVRARPASASCASPVNAIERENCLAGNPSSEWDINPKTGNPTIEGFAADISYNRGATAQFKVKTDAASIRIDVYRMGYYGGMGARKVATLTPASLPAQPACLTESASGLIDCGNWSVTASWTVPAAAVSGLYFAKLTRLDNGGASHLYFIVRDDAGTQPVLFQTSDATWQAYNPWGGNSLYIGGPTGSGGAYKVSYNRPFTVRQNYPTHPFRQEYPFIRWLESNAYDVAYFTDVDTDRRGALIRNHRLFLMVGHDEYWSLGQRTNVESARAAGVNLAFFSATAMTWKTRWEPSISAGAQASRTLTCYKESIRGKIDPQDPPSWTGLWREKKLSPASDGGRPENELVGQSYGVDAIRNDPMTVFAADGKLRFWRNTSAAALGAGQSLVLPQMLGHEWDLVTENAVRPPGLVRLSSSTIATPVPKHLENAAYVTGPATHQLTFYRHPSGARVFAAGTAQWGWGLDNAHDGGTQPTAQAPVQQATVNLFADLGVQPGALRPELAAAVASTDAAAPVSRVTYPPPGSNVAPGSLVTISGTAADAGGQVGGVEVSTDNGVTWRSALGRAAWTIAWPVTGTGTAQLRSRAGDDSGNVETPSAGYAVQRGTGTPPPPPPATPAITGLSPSSATAGAAAFTLSVTGTDFSTSAVVRWNGGNRTTTYQSATLLRAAIPASDVASVGTATVTVYNAGTARLSNPASFPVGSASSALFSDGFGGPDRLLTNEFAFNNPASTAAARSPDWDVTDGSLFIDAGEAWTGVPDDAAPNAGSTNGTGSAMFKLRTKRGDFGDVQVSFTLKNLGMTSTPSSPAQAWDGVHVLLRQQAVALYALSVNRRNNVAVVKKRLSSGAYVQLAQASYSVPYNTAQAVQASAWNVAGGSVSLRIDIGGHVVLAVTDAGSGGAPLTAPGRVGLQGDNAQFRVDDFTVRSFTGPGPAATVAAAGSDFRAFPNPWRSDQHAAAPLTFRLPAPAGEVKLFTVSGRRVRTLSASNGVALWDLRDDSGGAVASGYYLYLADYDGGRVRGLVAVIR